jgi:hypothetical protein
MDRETGKREQAACARPANDSMQKNSGDSELEYIDTDDFNVFMNAVADPRKEQRALALKEHLK